MTFLVLDGVDGAGKGTQIALLRDALVADRHRVHVTAEPSTFPVGALIRRYLRREITEAPPNAASMALLFAADRLQHVEHEIAPALARGEIVLCDRYDASSIAYQAALAPIEDEARMLRWIASINDHARRPHATLLLDLPPEIAAARRAARGTPEELYERIELQRRVRANYARIASVRPHDRIEIVDADAPIDVVHGRVLAIARAAIARAAISR